MDIELAIDMIEMAPHLDHIILFSGDGDFRRLVEVVQRKGVRVSVVSTVKSTPPMVADELRRQADDFIELQDLAKEISRAHQPRPEGEEDDGLDDIVIKAEQHEPGSKLPYFCDKCNHVYGRFETIQGLKTHMKYCTGS